MESLLDRAVLDTSVQVNSSDCESLDSFMRPILYSFVPQNVGIQNVIEELESYNSQIGSQMNDANNITNILCENNESIYGGIDNHADYNMNMRDESNSTLHKNTGELDGNESEDEIVSQKSGNDYAKPSTQDYFGDFESDEDNEVPIIQVRYDLFPVDNPEDVVVISDSDSDTNTGSTNTNRNNIFSTNELYENDFLEPDNFLQSDNTQSTTEIIFSNRHQAPKNSPVYTNQNIVPRGTVTEDNSVISETVPESERFCARHGTVSKVTGTTTSHVNSSHLVEISATKNNTVVSDTHVASILEQDLSLSESEVSNSEILQGTNGVISNEKGRYSHSQTNSWATKTHMPSILEQDLLLSDSECSQVDTASEEETDVLQSITPPINNYSMSNCANERVLLSCIAATDMPDITEDSSARSKQSQNQTDDILPRIGHESERPLPTKKQQNSDQIPKIIHSKSKKIIAIRCIDDQDSEQCSRGRYGKSVTVSRFLRKRRRDKGNYSRMFKQRNRSPNGTIIKIIEDITRSKVFDPDTKLKIIESFVKSMSKARDTASDTD